MPSARFGARTFDFACVMEGASATRVRGVGTPFEWCGAFSHIGRIEVNGLFRRVIPLSTRGAPVSIRKHESATPLVFEAGSESNREP
jgi:hypothetical protein